MVRREHEDPLAAAARPQPVREIQQPGQRDRVPAAAVLARPRSGSRPAPHLRRDPRVKVAPPGAGAGFFPVGQVDGAVDVLDYDDGLGARLHEELPELRVGVDLRELQIVDVVAEEVRHCGDHARLPSPRGAVQEVAALPCPAGLLVEALAVGEVPEVLHYPPFPVGVHGEGVEGAGVLEGHGLPGVAPGVQGAATGVGVEEAVLVAAADLGGPFGDEVEVGGEDEVLVPLPDAEGEAPLVLRERSPREGLGLALRDDVFPEDSGAVEGIGDDVIVGEAEGDGAGVEGARQAEAAASEGGGGGEVELDGVVELVSVDAVDLRYVEVAVGGEAVEDLVEELHGGKAELRREDGLEERLAEGEDA
ncbi:hypothetical protein PanWU01x14_039170 [Parasponia andersonii]|uniref:Uncharacterized protein n=1 Tax=Parasponia andersonii TaxID=3476 RepID=A0A2P5DRP6_PARAD|nr:hypothetical protein PanWU01x14_039170 [Parasponia andersonii]